MHATTVLHSLLEKALPGLHASRLRTLMEAVKAVARGASVSITSMGRALAGEAFIKHKIKRMDRLVGNDHLAKERCALYGVLTRRLLKGLAMPILLIDWSDLSKDRSWQLLRASLPVGGHALTLYEEVHPLSKLGNRKVQHRFLERLHDLVPAGTCPILVADSGFRVPFFRQVQRLGWHWLGRIRNRDFVALQSEPERWFSAKSLYPQATSKPRCLGPVQWVRSHPLAGRLVLLHRKPKGRVDRTLFGKRSRAHRSRKQAQREREPWLLVLSESLAAYSARCIVRYYQTRMQIEEGFRDTKSTAYGLGLAHESRIEKERLATLVLIAALASLLLWLIGTSTKGTPIERTVQVNTVKDHSVYSALFLARIVLQYTHLHLSQADIRQSFQSITKYFQALHSG